MVIDVDELKIYDLAEEYALSFRETNDFKRFLILKVKIEEELKKEIIDFKNAESKYLEAKEYGDFHPDLTKYKNDLIVKKSILYSNNLVIEYKELEQKLQRKLDDDLNELKQSISNKFSIKKIF